MKVIWKYPLAITDRQNLDVPDIAQALSVGLDPTGAPAIWFLVQPGPVVRRQAVFVVGTGNPLFLEAARPVGSFSWGGGMWHVFLG